MTTDDLLKFHEEFCSEARRIMATKNHDYAGADGRTPFANFESVEDIGLCSTETGFVVRILDKVKRLTTFCVAGVLKVKKEGPRDALMDILNYCILMAAYIQFKRDMKERAVSAQKEVVEA